MDAGSCLLLDTAMEGICGYGCTGVRPNLAIRLNNSSPVLAQRLSSSPLPKTLFFSRLPKPASISLELSDTVASHVCGPGSNQAGIGAEGSVAGTFAASFAPLACAALLHLYFPSQMPWRLTEE